jgi:HEAT repeat protein
MCNIHAPAILLAVWVAMDRPAVAEYPRARRETVIVSPRTLALIETYLASEDPRERSEALGMLRQARHPHTADTVRKLTRDPNATVRAQALLTLEALLSPAELIPILQENCNDEESVVVRQAIGILGGVPGPEAFTALMDVRCTLAPASLQSWALALARRDDPISVTTVTELLEAPDASIRAAAAQIAARHPDTIPLALRVELLADPNPQVRSQAVESLRDAKNDTRVREAISARLDDTSSFVRRSALEWLEGSTIELGTFEARLKDPDPTVRAAALRVAGRMDGASIVAKLIDRLSDPDLVVAMVASDQLVHVAAKQDDTLLADMLIALLKDASDQVVRLSARSLGLSKSNAAIEHLQALAEHPTESVRRAAYEAIGQIGQPGLVPWLLEAVIKESGYPRAAINEALGRLRDTAALDHLVADCHYPDKKSKGLNPSLFTPMGAPPPYPAAATAVATAAVQALGELGDPKAVPALVQVSRDLLRNEPFWTSVMSSLGKLGDVRAKPALVELGAAGFISQAEAIVTLPPTTRIEALRAMATLRITEAAEIIVAIEPADCVLEVRRVAAEVLSALTGRSYTYRLPARQSEFFIEDREFTRDLSEFKLPICYLVDGH